MSMADSAVRLAALGALQQGVEETLGRLSAERWAERLWQRDETLWPEQTGTGNWLGWLDVAGTLSSEIDELKEMEDDIAGEGFTQVVHCGMGGSSLCPYVLRESFGHRAGHPDLIVLDTTDPSAIAAVEAQLDPTSTVFVIASKSGGTLETLCHYRYFMERVRAAEPDHTGHHFIAITDEGSRLHQTAQEENFGWIFLNPA